jgi:hypothetical protein
MPGGRLVVVEEAVTTMAQSVIVCMKTGKEEVYHLR